MKNLHFTLHCRCETTLLAIKFNSNGVRDHMFVATSVLLNFVWVFGFSVMNLYYWLATSICRRIPRPCRRLIADISHSWTAVEGSMNSFKDLKTAQCLNQTRLNGLSQTIFRSSAVGVVSAWYFSKHSRKQRIKVEYTKSVISNPPNDSDIQTTLTFKRQLQLLCWSMSILRYKNIGRKQLQSRKTCIVQKRCNVGVHQRVLYKESKCFLQVIKTLGNMHSMISWSICKDKILSIKAESSTTTWIIPTFAICSMSITGKSAKEIPDNAHDGPTSLF